jgi:hypothetical protein
MARYVKALSDLVPLLINSSSPLPPPTSSLLSNALDTTLKHLLDSSGLLMSDKRISSSALTKIAYTLHVNQNRGSAFLSKCQSNEKRHQQFEDLYFYSSDPSSITLAAYILASEGKFNRSIMHVLDAKGAFVVDNSDGINISQGVYAMGMTRYIGSHNKNGRGKLVNAIEYNGGINKVFNAGPGAVAQSIFGAARLHPQVFPLTGLFNRANQPDVSHDLVTAATPVEVSRITWAMSQKGYDCPNFLQAVSEDSLRLVRHGTLHSISNTAFGIANMNRPAPLFFRHVIDDAMPYFLEKSGTPTEIATIMYALASARTAEGTHPLEKNGFAVNELWSTLIAIHQGNLEFSDYTLRLMHMTYLIARSVDYYFPSTPSKSLAEEMVQAANSLIQRDFDFKEDLGKLPDPNKNFQKTLTSLGFSPVSNWSSAESGSDQGYSGMSGKRFQDLISDMIGHSSSSSRMGVPPFPLELAHWVHEDSKTAIQFSSHPKYCHELIPPTKGYNQGDRREAGWARVQREVAHEVRRGQEINADHSSQSYQVTNATLPILASLLASLLASIICRRGGAC